MITYTDEIKPMPPYKPEEIWDMTPGRLKATLNALIKREPDLAGKIEVITGFPINDYMNVYQWLLVAIAWMKLEDPDETARMIQYENIDNQIQLILEG